MEISILSLRRTSSIDPNWDPPIDDFLGSWLGMDGRPIAADEPGAQQTTELEERGVSAPVPIDLAFVSPQDVGNPRTARGFFRRHSTLEIPPIDPMSPVLREPRTASFNMTRENVGFVVLPPAECRRLGLPTRRVGFGRAAVCVGMTIPMAVVMMPAPALAGIGQGGQQEVTIARIEGPPLPLAAAAPAGDMPDASWQGLQGRDVEVMRVDGSVMRGQLSGFDAQTVTLIAPDGSVLVVQRNTVSSVKVVAAAAPAPTDPAVAPAPAPLPADAAPAPQPMPPPPVNEKAMATGSALMISGGVLMGAGLITIFAGAGLAIDQAIREANCDSAYDGCYYNAEYYALVVVVPGVVVMLAVGLPLLLVGGSIRNKAKRGASVDASGKWVFHHQKGKKKGQPALTLRPSGPRTGWGGGLALEF